MTDRIFQNGERGIGSWSEYARLVLSEIEGLKQSYDEVRLSIEKINIELAVLKTKVVLIGFVASTFAPIIINYFLPIKGGK